MVSLGAVLSALFILAANSWMQHPVGYKVVHGQAVMTNFWAVMGNPMLWGSFAHTVLGALATAGALVLGISTWRAAREPEGGKDRANFLRASRLSALFTLGATALVAVSGDLQARLMEIYQPMKMAAAEALYNTKSGASFSLITIGNLKGQPVFQIRVPHLLSLIADLSWSGQVQGINNIQAAEAAKYGHGSYVPIIPLTYWSFRVMVGAGLLMIAISGWGAFLGRRRQLDRLTGNRWFRRTALWGMALPFVANTSGWIFTEAGRQPWIVYGLMTTAKGVSSVPTADLVLTLVSFIIVYSVIGAVDAWLLVRASRLGLDHADHDVNEGEITSLIY
jgi:cytochrome d ubiquinol oxidase subunit I